MKITKTGAMGLSPDNCKEVFSVVVYMYCISVVPLYLSPLPASSIL